MYVRQKRCITEERRDAFRTSVLPRSKGGIGKQNWVGMYIVSVTEQFGIDVRLITLMFNFSDWHRISTNLDLMLLFSLRNLPWIRACYKYYILDGLKCITDDDNALQVTIERHYAFVSNAHNQENMTNNHGPPPRPKFELLKTSSPSELEIF